MGYASVTLEAAPKPAAPSPIVAFRALRRAFTHAPVKCVECGAVTETFADAEHADGSVTGWVPVCEPCGKAKAPKAVEDPPAPAATPHTDSPSPAAT